MSALAALLLVVAAWTADDQTCYPVADGITAQLVELNGSGGDGWDTERLDAWVDTLVAMAGFETPTLRHYLEGVSVAAFEHHAEFVRPLLKWHVSWALIAGFLEQERFDVRLAVHLACGGEPI